MPVSPTRMNLIKTRSSLKLAKKGHSLLKRKREVLVLEFLRLLKESGADRNQMQKVLQKAYGTLASASTYVGDFELDQAANYIREPKPIGIAIKNVMGVRVPEIARSKEAASLLDRGYSIMSTSIAVDDVNESFNDVLNTLVEVARREMGLKRLVLEIDKVKRRVNALENVLLPRLRSRAKYISMSLEELDRDSFSGLKHIKRKLERSAEITAQS